jgi:tetratricopeptide (TPR) repeat protein
MLLGLELHYQERRKKINMGITTIFGEIRKYLLLCLIALSFISCGKNHADRQINDDLEMPGVSEVTGNEAPIPYEAPKKHKFTIAVTAFEIDSDVYEKLKAEARERTLAGLINNNSASEIEFTDTVNANTDCIVTGIIFNQNVVNMNKSLVVTSFDITVSCIEVVSKNIIDSWTINSENSLETAAMSMKLLSPDLYLQRAMLYAEQNYYELAIADFNTVIQMDQNLKDKVQAGIVNTLIKQGNSSIDAENYSAAKVAYSNAISLDINAINIILQKANSCYEQGEYAAADEMFDFIIAQITETGFFIDTDTILIRAYSCKAALSLEKSEFDYAIIYLNKALAIDPEDTALLKDHALVCLQTKDYDLAIADYTKCIELDPSIEHYAARANAYSLIGDFARSITDYTFILANDDNPDTIADARLSRGSVYLKAKDYTNSIKDYSDHLRYNPKRSVPFVYIQRSIAYRDSGLTDMALADLNTAAAYGADLLKEFNMAVLYIAIAEKVFENSGGNTTWEIFADTITTKIKESKTETESILTFPEEYNVIIDCLEKTMSYDNENEIKSSLNKYLLYRAYTKHLNNEFASAVTDYERAKEISGGLEKADKARLEYANKEKGIRGGFWNYGFGKGLFWVLIIVGIIVVVVISYNTWLHDIISPPPPPPSSGCFITTAVCKTLHKPDDCVELTKFRNFRDNFMQTTTRMREEVAEYYKIAPKICKNIDAAGKITAAKKYAIIWERSLKPAFEALDSGDKQKAYTLYKNMVLELKKEYLCGLL